MGRRSPRCEWPWVVAVVLVIVAGLTVFTSGQQGGRVSSLNAPILTYGPQGPAELVGLPDDWSHHHLVFSNPGTEEQAIKEGRYDEWLRVVNDPRYIMQQLKRRAPAQGPAAEYVARMNDLARAQEAAGAADLAEDQLQDSHRPVKGHRPVRPKPALHRDWSMDMGGGAAASLSGTVSNIGSGYISSSSSVTVDGVALDASAPTDETAAITFGGTKPANTSSVTIGSITYTFERSSISSGPSTGCEVYSAAGSTGATSLYQAISYTGTQGSANYECASSITAANSAVSASHTSGSSTVSLAAAIAGSTGFTFSESGTTHFSTFGSTAGTDGTQSGTDFVYWSGNAYLSLTAVAANIASTINANGTLNALFSATSNGAVVTVADLTGGTGGNSYTATASSFSGFAWSNSGDFSGGNTGVTADMGAGVFPAKYTFSTTSPPTCSDFVVYNTGVTGSSTGPTIIAYNNIYAGASPGCGTTGVPTVYWQYNTAYPEGSASADGSAIVTSVVLSYTGSQVAFLQSNSGGVASLVILKWSSSPSLVQMDTSSNNVTPANYPTCNAPCMTRITLDGSPSDTISAPFYDYSADTLYVGDASGKLHQFNPVFNGTSSKPPAEVETGGWPVTVSSGNALTSPVYDSVTGNIFVGDKGTAGYLYSVPATGTPTVTTSYRLAVSPGILDGPLVDSTAKTVYVFVGEDMNGSISDSPCTASESSASACAGIYQFPTNFTATTKWSESVLGVSNANTVYIGSFDNQYYNSESSDPTTPTGNLYACTINSSGYPKLMDATISAGAFTNESGGALGGSGGTVTNGTFVDASNMANPMTSAAANCSPVTEIYNANASTPTDWIFLSVSGSGDLTVCSGACIYSWNVTTTPTLQNTGSTVTQATQGLGTNTGTGGIIIDNISTQAGASQIYFGTLGATTCAGNGLGTGTGTTGGCAVQAAQSGL